MCMLVQAGDGIWTCAVCAGDGPGIMMSCPNRCRGCSDNLKCGFLQKPKHVCTDRTKLFAEFKKLGAAKEALCLPDCGRGKEVWMSGGLQWADPSRTLFGVRDSAAIVDIVTSTGDPLKHADVITLPLIQT